MQRLLAIVIVVACSSVLGLVLNIRVLHAKRNAARATTELWGGLAINTKLACIDSICCKGDSLVLPADLILEWTVCRVLWWAE